MNINSTALDAIRASQQGNLEAFNLLILHYQDFLFRVALRITGDEDMASDAVQETCLLLFKSISSFRDGSFRSWLARIVANVCFDEFRRQKRQRTRPLEPCGQNGEDTLSPYWLADFSTNPEREYQTQELSGLIQSYLGQLSHPYRTVLILIDMEEFSYEEAASALRVPVGTIKSRLARARMELRKKLLNSNYFTTLDRSILIKDNAQITTFCASKSCRSNASVYS
jgi:RNA polymerase sigma-70 factor, ECF subfamily